MENLSLVFIYSTISQWCREFTISQWCREVTISQTIEQRRDYFVATLIYKCINGKAPSRLVNELVMVSDTHDRSTRLAHSNNLYVPKPNCELFRNSFRYQGPVLWNSLPSEIKEASNIDCFKRMHKNHYFKQRSDMV